MKRFYLLAFIIGISGSLFAQTKSANLQLTSQVIPAGGGTKILLTDSKTAVPDTFLFKVKNLGPSDLTFADTIHFDLPYGEFEGTIDATKGLKVGDSITFADVTKVGPSTLKSQTVASFPWCDSIWVTSGGNVVPDADVKNNVSCNTLELTVWATSINNNGDISTHEIAVYPNPANNAISVRFDFGTSASGNLAVRDILGHVVYRQDLDKNINGEREFKVDASNFSSGLYFVELTVNNTKKVAKVTVQK